MNDVPFPDGSDGRHRNNSIIGGGTDDRPWCADASMIPAGGKPTLREVTIELFNAIMEFGEVTGQERIRFIYKSLLSGSVVGADMIEFHIDIKHTMISRDHRAIFEIVESIGRIAAIIVIKDLRAESLNHVTGILNAASGVGADGWVKVGQTTGDLYYTVDTEAGKITRLKSGKIPAGSIVHVRPPRDHG